jgi:hypothetical protein
MATGGNNESKRLDPATAKLVYDVLKSMEGIVSTINVLSDGSDACIVLRIYK